MTPPNFTVKVGAWVNIPLPGQMTLPHPDAVTNALAFLRSS